MSNIDFKFHNIEPVYEMSFSNDDGIVAKLKWDKGTLTHEGNVDISAELFLDMINAKGLTQYNEMKAKINRLEHDLTVAKTQNDIYRKAMKNE